MKRISQKEPFHKSIMMIKDEISSLCVKFKEKLMTTRTKNGANWIEKDRINFPTKDAVTFCMKLEEIDHIIYNLDRSLEDNDILAGYTSSLKTAATSLHRRDGIIAFSYFLDTFIKMFVNLIDSHQQIVSLMNQNQNLKIKVKELKDVICTMEENDKTDFVEELQGDNSKTELDILRKYNDELFEELLTHSIELPNMTWKYESNLFNFTKFECHSNGQEMWYMEPFNASNLSEDYHLASDLLLACSFSESLEIHILRNVSSLLHLVVVSSHINFEMFHYIRQASPFIRFMIRHENYYDMNIELLYPLPESFIPSFEPMENTLNPKDSTIIKAICHGPEFSNEKWVENSNVLWVFSKFKGLMPVEYPELPTNTLFLQYSAEKLATYLETDDTTGPFSGLLLRAKEPRFDDRGRKLEARSSCGILGSVNIENKTINGIFTAKHGFNDGEEVYYSLGDDHSKVGYVRYLTKNPFVEVNSGDLIDCDFCIIEFCDDNDENNAYVGKADEYNSEISPIDALPISLVATSQQIISDNVKRVFKSGARTGLTSGRILGHLTRFENINPEFKSKMNTKMALTTKCVADPQCKDESCIGCYLCKGCSFILIYDVNNTFALTGDSGGLCWYETSSKKVHAIGLIIGRIEKRLFCVLPLTSIVDVCQKVSFKIESNSNLSDDVEKMNIY